MNGFLQKFKFHFLAIGIFLVVSVVYCMPVLSGKVLKGNDLILGEVLKKSAKESYDKTGKVVHWTNSMFSGMPDTYGTPLSNLFYKVPLFLGSNVFGGHYSWDTLFWFMIASYLLMCAFGLNTWQRILGAIILTFSSFNMMSLEGGHVMKVLAAGALPGVLAGLVFLGRKRYMEGTILFIFYMNCMLSLNHTQITYYMLMMTIIYCIVLGIVYLMKKDFKHVMMVAAIVGGVTAVSAAANYNLLNVVVSAKETIRSGKSEIVAPGEKAKEGLDLDYATLWSNGVSESFTFLIPNFMGGSSEKSLLENEYGETLKALQTHPEGQQLQQRAGAYWGEQNFVSGGNYFGAIVIFLFVLSLMTVKDNTKYALLSVGLFFLLLSFGRNFHAFTDIAFYYFPMYNKFRVPSMCLSVVQVIIAVMAMWGLKEIFNPELSSKDRAKYLYIASGITLGILLIFIAAGSSFFAFASDMDIHGDSKRGIPPLPAWMLAAVKADRFSLMRADALRSFGLVLVAAGALYLAVTNKIKASYAIIGVGIIAALDLWNVDTRYLNSDDFIEEGNISQVFTPTVADQNIHADASDYRVFNIFDAGGGPNPFNDAVCSYHHQSIGGYHPAKLRRYQEMIERHIGRGNPAVLNMLNMRYVIGGNTQSGAMAQPNPGALGSAWFVKNLQQVKDGYAEINALESDPKNPGAGFDPKSVAVMQSKYAELMHGVRFQYDSSATIKLIDKNVYTVKYAVNNKTPQLAVFSEMFYQLEDGDGWKAKIDGKEAPVMKADFILRALLVPAGAQEIVFEYDSSKFDQRNMISFFTSLVLLAVIVFLLYRYYKTTDWSVAVAAPKEKKVAPAPKPQAKKK